MKSRSHTMYKNNFGISMLIPDHYGKNLHQRITPTAMKYTKTVLFRTVLDSQIPVTGVKVTIPI